MVNAFFAGDVWKYLLGAIMGSFLPTPMDPIHFYVQNWLYRHKQKKWKFELIEILDWYFLTVFWYIFLVILAILLSFDRLNQINQVTIMLTVIGVGSLVSIIWRFLIKKKYRKVPPHAGFFHNPHY